MGGTGQDISLAEAKSALSWWLQAGVDGAIGEDARNWLKPAPARSAPGIAAPVSQAREPHQNLEQFRLWLEQSDALPLRGTDPRRVLPRGTEQAPVMLLAEMPSAEDAAAGQPLSGDCWLLARAMLTAAGISADDAYCASLSCFHAPGAKLRGADLETCAEIAREHLRLARPQRLLLLGEAPCQALLGKGLLAARGHRHKVEGVPAVATFHPRHLIHRTLDKPRAWEDLLLLMEEDA
ncbi:MAG: uracil-DNA glycosylase [Sphingomicrobium sp.]